MKTKLTFVLLTFFYFAAVAQWKPTNGLFSGEVHSVITSNNEIIVGTKQIYKSTDNGKTWFVSNNGMSGGVGYIRCLAKINAYLVAGTDAGVFYSSDNGNNWIQSAGTASLDVFCIVVKGANLFMSTGNNGVYKSTTNGTSWSAANSGISNTSNYMRAIVVKGTDLYVATEGYGIFKSSTDGSLWNAVNNGLPGSYYSVSSLAVVGDNIIAGTYGAGVYKSIDNGGSWSAVNNGISSSDVILGMGVNDTSIYASTINGSLFKTTDYINWNAVAVGPFTATRYEAFYASGSDFYVGCWGFQGGEKSYGVFKTTDDGTTWNHIGITDYPVSVLEVSGNNILGGTYDATGNSFRISLFKTTEADSTWSFNIGGFTGLNITALKASGASVYLFDNEGYGSSQVYHSTNNGMNWTSTGFNTLYNNFNNFVIAGALLYATDNSSSYNIYVSPDYGQSWTVPNSGLSSVQNAYALVLKGTVLFLGTDNGVFKNIVGQNNWTSVSSGLTNMYIKSLTVSGNTIYAGTQGGGIFKSVNDGGQWNDCSTGIPLFANTTCFATAGGNVFAGTDNGVFVTADTGSTWTKVNTGLIDTSITAMVKSTNYLWVGTTSQGVWRRELTQIVTGTEKTITEPSFYISPNPATDKLTIEIPRNNSNAENQISIYNSVGSLVWYKNTPDAVISVDMANFSKGIYLVRIFSNNRIHTEKVVVQ